MRDAAGAVADWGAAVVGAVWGGGAGGDVGSGEEEGARGAAGVPAGGAAKHSGTQTVAELAGMVRHRSTQTALSVEIKTRDEKASLEVRMHEATLDPGVVNA